MSYPRNEQETVLVFDRENEEWTAYSTIPKHIRKLFSITEEDNIDVLEKEDDGTIKSVKVTLSEKQVRMVSKVTRVMTDEQKEAAAERLRKAREKIGAEDGTSDEDFELDE